MCRRVSLSDDLVLELDIETKSVMQKRLVLFLNELTKNIMSASSKEYIRGSNFNFTSLSL